MKRNVNLDLIRLACCIGVVGLHTMYRDEPILNLGYYLCGFSIPCFFMTSGYVLLNRGRISWSYLNKISTFVKTIVFLELIYWMPLFLSGSRNLSVFIIDFLKDVIKSPLQRGKLGHLWFFTGLSILYCLLPLLTKVKRETLLLYFTICAVFSFLLMGISCWRGYSVQSKVLQPFRIWTSLKYFILGGLMADAEKYVKKISISMHTVCLIAVSIGAVFYQKFIGIRYLNNMYLEVTYDSIVMMIWAIVIFTWGLRIKINENMEKYIVLLGSYTTGIYLVHIFWVPINLFGFIPWQFVKGVCQFLFVLMGAISTTVILKKFRI